jgi:preprotein translocase subunit YajC
MVFISCVQVKDGSDESDLVFNLTIIIFLVFMVVIFYFLMIRPQQKRQKQVQQMNQDLKRGDRVVTIGGIWGEIESINDDSVLLKMESGATVRMARSSIASIREEEQPKF